MMRSSQVEEERGKKFIIETYSSTNGEKEYFESIKFHSYFERVFHTTLVERERQVIEGHQCSNCNPKKRRGGK